MRRKQPVSFVLGSIRRVEIEPIQPVTPVDTRTDHQKLVDFYFDKCLREDAQRKADEQRAATEAQQKRLREQVEHEKVRRKQEFESAEALIAGVYDQHGLSQDERSAVDDILHRLGLWKTPMSAVERATVEAMLIVAERSSSKD